MPRLLLSFCALLLFACVKDNHDRTLVGRWVSVEVFSSSATGGCNCWSIVVPATEHSIYLNSNGTYAYMPPLISSMPPCSGDYSKASDSTISWNWCGQQRTDRFYFDHTFLIIEKDLPGGLSRTRYRRWRPL